MSVPPDVPPPSPLTDSLPRLGLVCITTGPEVRYRTITRTRYLTLSDEEKVAALDGLYRANVRTLFGAVDFCRARGIRLYRATSNLFPQIDHPVAQAVFQTLHETMAGFGKYAEERGVRVLLHPDQYVVLNSLSPDVVRNSVGIMRDHAEAFDRLGLPRTPWSAMILHGGKGGRGPELVETIRGLPAGIRGRLVLENDESAYGAAAILDICRAAGVPMVFDAHHHAVKEKLDTYEHPSVAEFTRLSRDTWPDPAWHLVHLSNGHESFADPRHSELISVFPSAFRDVPWVEVEAKGKETAIDALCLRLAEPPTAAAKNGPKRRARPPAAAPPRANATGRKATRGGRA